MPTSPSRIPHSTFIVQRLPTWLGDRLSVLDLANNRLVWDEALAMNHEQEPVYPAWEHHLRACGRCTNNA